MHSHNGLSSAEVAERVKRGQTNAFEARVGRNYWDIFRDNVFNLFNIVLFSLLLLVLLLRDYATVFFSGFSVVTNTFLGMIQEINAKRKLDRMASLAAKTVDVWRDGQRQTISIHDIVLDDVLVIEPGSRLSVDGVIIASDALEVDESQLTGESDAVYKNVDDPVYSGSYVVAGSGLMRATRVGRESAINQLSVIAKAYKQVLTPTQKKINTIVEITVLLMVITAPMLLVASMLQGDSTLQVIRNQVVFVTSMVPQGLVLVAVLALTIGAVKISRHKTLIQRVNAVESLANVTVLCFDKTGTLTQNRLAVQQIIPLDDTASDTIDEHLALYMENLSYHNTTAGAIAESVRHVNGSTPHKVKHHEIPFTSGRKWGAIAFDDATFILGAPERLLTDQHPIHSTADALAAEGMRVLAFAQTRHPLAENGAELPRAALQPLALIVMSDQIREDIRATLDDFRILGVRLKVISGDNLTTVRAIAGQAGMAVEHAYTGAQLKTLNDHEFAQAVREADIFARIEPDMKRRIVQALQADHEYVAMVGDGVNDVPALKAANLAIVMNDGTQISKDVADIVLLNNAMSTLPRAFREGREITQTIFGTTKMFLAKNAYNFLLFIFLGFMTLPFPITPAQISVAAFGTVNMPATLIAFGFIRPKYVGSFRHDVVDYLLTTALIGAAVMTFLFAVVYFLTGGDREAARSALTLFICLFGMMIVWHVQGVEVYEPSTFVRYWRVVVVSGLATIATILAFYARPALFEFVPPDPTTSAGVGIIALITALFCLTLMLVNHGIRYPQLINRMWMLVVDHEKISTMK